MQLSLWIIEADYGDTGDGEKNAKIMLPRELFFEKNPAPKHGKRAIG